MKFKVGDKILLVRRWDCCCVGDLAVVVQPPHQIHDEIFIGIKWIRNKDDKDERVDGGYYPHQFKLTLQKGEQLEFSFMRD